MEKCQIPCFYRTPIMHFHQLSMSNISAFSRFSQHCKHYLITQKLLIATELPVNVPKLNIHQLQTCLTNGATQLTSLNSDWSSSITVSVINSRTTISHFQGFFRNFPVLEILSFKFNGLCRTFQGLWKTCCYQDCFFFFSCNQPPRSTQPGHPSTVRLM